ncbi:MAG: hypothetical protein ACI867_001493 [Glaciecola sp.]|jgi:hypothetical protein
MSRIGIATLFLAALSLAAAAPSQTATAASNDQTPITLGAETSFLVEGARYVQVVLPRDARLDVNDDPERRGNAVDVKIEAAADERGNRPELDSLVGISLDELGAVSGLEIVRLPGSQNAFASTNIAQIGPGCNDCQLNAGIYDLVIISDTPVEVTFTIDELDPVAHGGPIKLTQQIAGAILNEASVTTTYADSTVFGGAPHIGAGWRDTAVVDQENAPIQTFFAFWFDGVPVSDAPDPDLLVQLGVASPCRYLNPVDDAELFQPGCPTGNRNGVISTVARQGREAAGLTYGWTSGIGAGDHVQGGVVEYAGARNVGAAGYWYQLP